MYDSVASLPPEVQAIIPSALGRRLLWLEVCKALGAGASEAVAFAKGYAALSAAGYVRLADGTWQKAADTARPLYVYRPVLNPEELVRWANDAGIMQTLAPDDLHVTVAYSKAPVAWDTWQPKDDLLWIDPATFSGFPDRFGDAMVLRFYCEALERRWREFVAGGASWDHESYHPHVTITYAAGFEPYGLPLYTGGLLLGPEVFAPVNTDWKAKLAKAAPQRLVMVPSGDVLGASVLRHAAAIRAEMPVKADEMALLGAAILKAYKPNQPRAPKGSPQGGQWIPAKGWAAGLGLGTGLVAPQFGLNDGWSQALDRPYPQRPIAGPTPVNQNGGPGSVARYVAGNHPGKGLNGVPFKSWTPPKDTEGWAKVEGQMPDLDDGRPLAVPKHKRAGAGVLIREPDGRVWLVHPTNEFGGYKATFPKGTLEEGLSLQATAIKEAFEESGLKVRITGVVGDFERTTSVARYYWAERTGGSPTDYHYETEAVSLVPIDSLGDFLNGDADQPIRAELDGVAKYNAAQPRAPRGTPIGGQWIVAGTAFAQGPMGWTMAIDPEVALVGITSVDKALVKKKLGALNSLVAAGDAAGIAALKTYTGQGLGKVHKQWNIAVEQAKNFVAAKAAKAGQAPVKVGATVKPADGKPVPMADWKQVGAKPGGSAQGALYVDADGAKWLVKKYQTHAQAQNEVLASHLYAMAGVAVPDMKLVDLGPHLGGGMGVASRWIDGVQAVNPKSADHLAAVQKHFAADAWLANWDVVGLTYDNVVMTPDGLSAVRIDPGGALLYRATGAPKGNAFTTNLVAEIDTLRDPSLNPTAAAMFGSLDNAAIAVQAAAIAKLDNVKLAGLVDIYAPGDKAAKAALLNKLIGRKQYLAEWAGKHKAFEEAPPAAKEAAVMAASVTSGLSLPKPYDFALPHYVKIYAKLEAATKAGDWNEFKAIAADAVPNYVKNGQTWQNDGIEFSASVAKLAPVAYATAALGGKIELTDSAGSTNHGMVTTIYGDTALAAYHPANLPKPGIMQQIAEQAKVTLGEMNALKASQANAPALATVAAAVPAPKVTSKPPAGGGFALVNPARVKVGGPTDTKLAQQHVAEINSLVAQGKWSELESYIPSGSYGLGYKAIVLVAAGKPDALASGNINAGKLLNGWFLGKSDGPVTTALAEDFGLLDADGNPMKADAMKAALASKGLGATSAAQATAAPGVAQATASGIAALPPAPTWPATSGYAYVNSKMAKLQAAIAANDSAAIAKFKPYTVHTKADKQFNEYLAAVQNYYAGGNKAPAAMAATAAKAAEAATAKAPPPKAPPKVVPEKLPPKPDFVNWNGPGKGLSGTAAVNLANQEAASKLFDIAATGDMAALKAATYAELDKTTGQPTGKLLPINQHPSQHVRAYHAALVDTVDNMLNPPPPPKKFRVSEAGKVYGELAAQHPKLSPQEGAKGNRIGRYVVLGTPGTVDMGKLPYKPHSFVDQGVPKAMHTAHYEAFSKLPAYERDAIKSYTGGGYKSMNNKLSAGDFTGAAKAAATGVAKAAQFLEPGLQVSRKFEFNSSADMAKFLKHGVGSVLQDTGIVSTAITPGTWSGQVQLRLTAGEGVRGLYVGKAGAGGGGYGSGPAISNHPSENEVIFAPGMRILVTSIQKNGKEGAWGGGSQYLVDAIILPTD